MLAVLRPRRTLAQPPSCRTSTVPLRAKTARAGALADGRSIFHGLTHELTNRTALQGWRRGRVPLSCILRPIKAEKRRRKEDGRVLLVADLRTAGLMKVGRRVKEKREGDMAACRCRYP